jgi:hypothetical protein
MGMASIRVSTPQRRDRLWLLNAFAVVLLTLLGAAGEALGYDRHLDGKSIWVFDRCSSNGCNPIQKFDSNGKFVRGFGANMFNQPHGLYVDNEGNVWVLSGTRGLAGPFGATPRSTRMPRPPGPAGVLRLRQSRSEIVIIDMATAATCDHGFTDVAPSCVR